MKFRRSFVPLKNFTTKMIILLFDLFLAAIYMVALIFQKTKLYQKIGSDRLTFTKRITRRLTSFFDPKVFYDYYERLFEETFLPPPYGHAFEKKSEKRTIKRTISSSKLSYFYDCWNKSNPDKRIERASYALLSSIFNDPPSTIYVFNVADHLTEVIEFAQEVFTENFELNIDLINLDLFKRQKLVSGQLEENKPLKEIASQIVEKFGSRDLFLFGLGDPVPPLGHVNDVFIEIFPHFPAGMRVAAYGVSEKDDEDEWIRWNVSSWNAEILLEAILSNSMNLILEEDSRLLDLSFDKNLQESVKERYTFRARDLIVLRRF